MASVMSYHLLVFAVYSQPLIKKGQNVEFVTSTLRERKC